jgi:putative salt-induced outer membrane protein YdiY
MKSNATIQSGHLTSAATLRRDPPWRFALSLAVGALLTGVGAQAADPPAAASAAPEPSEKKSTWESSASVGFTLTSGNSDTLMFTARVLALRKWDKNELSLGADGAYGETDDEKSTENVHGFVQYNRLFSDRFYGYARADALHDAVADVEYRVTLSPGVGYYVIKNETTQLGFEVGPGVVLEKQGDDESEYFTLRLAEKFEHKFNDRARVWQSVEFLPQVDDWDNFIVNAEIGLGASLSKKLELQTYLQDTYDNEPAPGKKENDLKWVTAIALKF